MVTKSSFVIGLLIVVSQSAVAASTVRLTSTEFDTEEISSSSTEFRASPTEEFSEQSTKPMTSASTADTTDYTTTSPSSTTPETTSSTLPTTTPAPIAPVITPDPYLADLFTSSMTLSEPANTVCSDSFAYEFRRSAQEVIGRVNDAVNRNEMCVDSHALASLAGQMQIFFMDTVGQATYSALVSASISENAPQDATVRSFEVCAYEVGTFMNNITNWRQPIIPYLFGCPTVTVNNIDFNYGDTKWSCF